MKLVSILILILLTACNSNKNISFKTIDTDYSKGRLRLEHQIKIYDLEKFHGHLCDGLVLGALAMQEGLKQLYPNQAIDRTNLRIVSNPSPCLTDVAVYLTGGRYQFNTFYADTNLKALYIIQQIDNKKTIKITLKKGIKPAIIDSLGALAIQGKLSTCDIDKLQKLENQFTKKLYSSNPESLFQIEVIENFLWAPNNHINLLKTDIINKKIPDCND